MCLRLRGPLGKDCCGESHCDCAGQKVQRGVPPPFKGLQLVGQVRQVPANPVAKPCGKRAVRKAQTRGALPGTPCLAPALVHQVKHGKLPRLPANEA